MVKKGYKQTEIGVIPEDWEVKRIGDMSIIISGGTPNTKIPNFWNGNINWFTPTEIGIQKYIYNSKRKISEQGLQNSSSKILPIGTILLTSRAVVGDLAILKTEGSTNQGIQSIIVNKNIYNEFIYYLFNILKNEFIKNASGSTFLEISPQKIKEIKIPIPPKKEQEAIAKVLSDTDALIESLESLIAKKTYIKKATMQQLLTGKKRLKGFSGEWVEFSFSKVVWFQEGPGVRKYQFVKSGIKLLNGTNIYKGKITLNTTDKYISIAEATGIYKHFLADKDDIVIACSGITIDKFEEKVAIVKQEYLPFCMNTSTMRFKPIKFTDRDFIYYFLMSSEFKKQIGNQATGSAQLNFGPSHVSKIKIKLPPLTEQKAIAKILSDMDKEIETLKEKLEKIKAIKQGMMQELLSGKIRLIQGQN